MRLKHEPGAKRVAAIDLGTNTFRILVADASGDAPRELAREQIIVRLGGGYDSRTNILSAQSIERAMAAIGEFAAIIEEHRPLEINAVATEIVRRAKNGADFVNTANTALGTEIKVIGASREAALAFSGIRAYIPSGVREFAAIDIGGGSVEWTASDKFGRLKGWLSLPIGIVGLAETILEGDPPTEESLAACERKVRDAIAYLPERLGATSPIDTLVGTGGTATSLAALDLGLSHYDVAKVQNHVIGKEQLEYLGHRIYPMTLDEKSDVFPLGGGREDLIVPGIIITIETLNVLNAKELMVSDAGLLEGLALARTQVNERR